MSSTLSITTELIEDHYLITAEILPGGTLPKEIFIYENNGSDTLGSFYGTTSVEELGRLQIFLGSAIPTFGNRFYRYEKAKIKVSLQDDPVAVANSLVKNVILLSKTLSTKILVSQNFQIP